MPLTITNESSRDNSVPNMAKNNDKLEFAIINNIKFIREPSIKHYARPNFCLEITVNQQRERKLLQKKEENQKLESL